MSESGAISILTQCLIPYDAIGNDIAQMRSALVDSGFNVRIFAEGIHPALASIAEPIHVATEKLWQSSGSILIYHHSTGWPLGEDILFNTRNKIMLRYHNITPAHFFAPYSLPHFEACEFGIRSTKRIAKLPKMLIAGDSSYNCDELIALGANPKDCRVLAPFHLTEELSREMFDFVTISKYAGPTANILFVGGVKPNKGHAGAIRVFAEYKHCFNGQSRLIFAGRLDDRLAGYVEDLKTLASQLGVADQIIFTGAVTAAQMKSLYVSADVFLCTSEHEGFCVPLVESMYFRVPVVAWGMTAVSETMGQCGYVIDEWNEHVFAAHINRIVEDGEIAERLGTLGRDRYRERYTTKVLRKQLNSLIAELT